MKAESNALATTSESNELIALKLQVENGRDTRIFIKTLNSFCTS